MHGSLQVTSREGEGSTFHFSLPLQPAPICADAPVSDNPARDNPHARILVAEDNVVNQQVIRHLLGHLGHSVDVVSNGRAAVQAFETGGYDIIVMDCQMPEMSGYDAAIRIRQREAGHVPIIALTASALSGDRERCLEAGMDDYLTKPVTLSSLASALNKWVERRPEAGPVDSLAAMARSVGPLDPTIAAETVHEPG
jgi:CheY-like chemotaxis protein